jgi:hypothetical protein
MAMLAPAIAPRRDRDLSQQTASLSFQAKARPFEHAIDAKALRRDGTLVSFILTDEKVMSH